MKQPNESCWIVVVLTNKYAGNFERKLCAYCTGVVGYGDVGEELANDFPYDRDVWYDKMIQFSDDNGYHSPVSIWSLNDSKFNDVAMFFYDRPSEEELDIIYSRAKKFAEKEKIKVLDFKLLEYKIKRTTKIWR